MAVDILLDDDNELIIKDGDIMIGDSRYQHVKHLLEAEKGYFKFSPQSGVGMTNLLNDEFAPEEILRLVRFEVERDGFKIEKLLFSNEGKIELEGDYKG